MRLGKIVKSNAHTDYVCQIDNPGEVEQAPGPADYAFGTFVRLQLAAQSDYLVGLIYSTILMNPEFGNLGPRLSTTSELEIFSPDYLQEQATLVGVIAIGQVTGGNVFQGVPRLAASLNAVVEVMTSGQVQQFHQANSRLALAYAPVLLAQGDPLVYHLLLSVVDQLDHLFPDHKRQLAVLRGNLAWKATVTPAG